MSSPIGIIVNPRSGNDVRRVVASAGSSTLEDKASIVRRVVKGAAAHGATHFIANREPHRVTRRATETMAGVTVDYLPDPLDNTEADSTRAAAALRDAGCGVVVVLGGDGTNRAVCKGWPDVPVIPLSTGTNNAFPVWFEPTVAGSAAALVVTGAVALDAVTHRAKLVHVTMDVAPPSRPAHRWDPRAGVSAEPDIALIDAVAAADPFVGSLDLFDPDTLIAAVLTRADPAAIGFCAVGGLLDPLDGDDDGALLVEFTPPRRARRCVLAPTAPGHVAPIGVTGHRRLRFGEPVVVAGPAILAFDGERKRRLFEGDHATLSVWRDGPRVVDVRAAMRAGLCTGEPA